MTEHALSNARIVLEDDIILGSVLIRDGKIADISEGASKTGEDLEGDFLIPGLVELHTDHLEQHYSPRPGVIWDKIAAIQAHDAQVASSGITTVFDCLRLGSDEDGGFKRAKCAKWLTPSRRQRIRTACVRTTCCICAVRSLPPMCLSISKTSKPIRACG